MKYYNGKLIYDRNILLTISLIFGGLGFDRLFLQDYKGAILKFSTLGGLGIWYLLDIFRIITGQKLGYTNYIWKCEINNNCNLESYFYIKLLAWFSFISFISYYFYYPNIKKNINDPNKKI